ncbi:hypothetical protein CDL15_Pgr010180 [Punica granatum]|uniref:Uncharacterized protein n=1 Tax=Punica granatum TaxID=22663 RepID=A0A218XQR6_PUNGR|nr:hypothetical protein CDL15_Pgr010180 [Punica granatum]
METMSPVQVKDVLEDSSPPLEGRKTGLALRSSMATATEQQREEVLHGRYKVLNSLFHDVAKLKKANENKDRLAKE